LKEFNEILKLVKFNKITGDQYSQLMQINLKPFIESYPLNYNTNIANKPILSLIDEMKEENFLSFIQTLIEFKKKSKENSPNLAI